MDPSGHSVDFKVCANAKQREALQNEPPKFGSTTVSAPSPCVRPPSRGREPVNDRLYNFASHEEKKNAMRVSCCARRLGVSFEHERLYSSATKKRVVEKDRRMKELEKLEKEKPEGVQLATRPYTPAGDRTSFGHEQIHSRLYSLAKVKNCVLEQQHQEKNQDDRSRVQSTAGTNRMYARSLKQQQEGQERRQKIEMAKRRPIRPSGKISLGKATGIYNRGMMQKMKLETKRENEGNDTSYVSPLLNPLFTEGDDNGEFCSQADSQMARTHPSSISASRLQSITGRRGRSKTPLHSASRSGTLMGARAMTIGYLPIKENIPTPRSDGSRIRARSRLRSSTPTMFSFRSPSPAPAPRDQTSISTPTLILRGRTSTPRRGRHSATPQRGGRSATPQRAVKGNSTKDLLRQMEDEEFYKNIKQAIAQKESGLPSQ